MASSALGYDFKSPCPNIINKKLGKITLTGAQLKLVRSIAELETGDVLTYTDSGSNTYYLTASRLLLPFSNKRNIIQQFEPNFTRGPFTQSIYTTTLRYYHR